MPEKAQGLTLTKLVCKVGSDRCCDDDGGTDFSQFVCCVLHGTQPTASSGTNHGFWLLATDHLS